MSSVKRAARAIRHQDKETANNQVREIEYAEVRRVNPLVLKLEGSSITLDEEDLTISQWVEAYDLEVGVKQGDKLAVKRMREGGWFATDVVGGPSASPYTGSGVGDGSVTSAKIASGAVTSAKIANDAVGSAQIASNAVGSSEIAADAVGSSEIAADAVGSSEIATSAVGTSELADDSVTAAKIATDAVGSSEIAADAVGSSEIAANAVTSSEIASDAVTTAKIATDAVTAAKIGFTYEAKTTATFTPVTADLGKLIGMDRSTAQTVSIDAALDLAAGERIDFIQLGAGQVTFQSAASPNNVTLNATPGLKMRARYSSASIVCVGTDTYVVVGDLAA